MLLNLFLFLAGCWILWKGSELVVNGVEKFSNNLKISSFATSFLILGILTSLTEMSVGINAILDKKPEVFVGNLIGASFVILLLIIPILAIFNGGIVLKTHLDSKNLFLFLVLIVSPSLIIIDGEVTRYDAMLPLLIYALFFYTFQKSEHIENINFTKLDNKTVTRNLGRIVFGAILIYIASKVLVDNTIYFADLIGIPSFIISLIILSIGTNLPELTIAANSIRYHKPDVAFGDYIGSAATNVLLFSIFTMIYGPFSLERKGFNLAFLLIIFGYALFFLFARSKKRISGLEGLVLLMVYLAFLMIEISHIFSLSSKI
jgi:cation:H+ antiporter